MFLRVTGLGAALGTQAAHGPYDVGEILFPLVIREFFTYFDRALRHDEHPSPSNFNFAIGSTGVIDEARSIFLVPTVYRRFLGDLKEVAVPTVKPLFFLESGADIFDNTCSFGNGL